MGAFSFLEVDVSLKDEQQSAEAIWAEETAAVFSGDEAADEAATSQQPETAEPAKEEAQQAGAEQGTAAEAAPDDSQADAGKASAEDEWAGVPEVVRKRFTEMSEDMARREHALKSKYGREIADLKRQLETAKPPQVDLESLPNWKELTTEFEPIAKGVEEYVSQALAKRGVESAPISGEVVTKMTVDAVSAITDVDVEELTSSEQFKKWIADKPDFIRDATEGGVRGGVRVIKAYQNHTSEAARAAKLQEDRQKRLKGAVTPQGQAAPGATSDGSTLTPEQLWALESQGVWKERSA